MTPAHRRAIAVGVCRSWRNGEIRERHIAGISAYWDDPLLRAIERARTERRERTADGRFARRQ